MTGKRRTTCCILISCIVATMTTIAIALTIAPTTPLAERVSQADTIFIGTITNKVVDGDWVRADLIVQEPLKNAEKGKHVPVTWRLIIEGGELVPEKIEGNAEGPLKRVGGRPVFDVPAGSRAIAILDDKHEGRYWLRADKFVDLAQFAEVKKSIRAMDGKPAREGK